MTYENDISAKEKAQIQGARFSEEDEHEGRKESFSC